MSEKVKLPKNVAEAIERVWQAVQDDIGTKHMRLTNWNFLKDEVEGHQVLEYDWKTLMGYAETYPLEYMQALVNGYEIELTPEEKVREYYQIQKCAVVNGHDFDNPSTAIRYVLGCLNIKIDGVW